MKKNIINIMRQYYDVNVSEGAGGRYLALNTLSVPTEVLLMACRIAGVKHYRICGYGQKWPLSLAEPLLTRFVIRYNQTLGQDAIRRRNVYDVGCMDWSCCNIVLLSFSDMQLEQGQLCNRKLHEVMDRATPHGGIEFSVRGVRNISVKIYQEFVHEIKACIKSATLNDVPASVSTLRKRLETAQKFLAKHEDPTEFAEKMVGLRVECTVRKLTFPRQARERLCKLDFLCLQGFERRRYGGPFMKEQVTRAEWADGLSHAINTMRSVCSGSNTRSLTTEMKHLLILVRTMMGWCGKDGNKKLDDMRVWQRNQTVNQVVDAAIRTNRIEDVMDQVEEMADNNEITEEKVEEVHEMLEEMEVMRRRIKWRKGKRGGFMISKKGKGHPLPGRWMTVKAACQAIWHEYGSDWRDIVSNTL